MSETTLQTDNQKAEQLKGAVVVVKYGGNAMSDDAHNDSVLLQVADLKKKGVHPVIVHGGGPFIKDILEIAGIKSSFVDGHRVTDREAMVFVEMALRGQVNGTIVRNLNALGMKAVGLSGKDASMVQVTKRLHSVEKNGKREELDLGYVGNVVSVDTTLIHTLLNNDYIPVLAPIASGSDHMDYNINADMFAGCVAGALGAAAYVALTNVDGLLENPDDPSTLIRSLTLSESKSMIGGAVQGGMIPKIESCITALERGAGEAHIINGMKPGTLVETLLTNNPCGTTLIRD